MDGSWKISLNKRPRTRGVLLRRAGCAKKSFTEKKSQGKEKGISCKRKEILYFQMESKARTRFLKAGKGAAG
jgi:hypothetical protein